MAIIKLNEDILYLIFKTFQDHKPTLYSCLLVNKTWCEIIIPILWRDPWKNLDRSRKDVSLLSVIVSYFSKELRNNLRQNIIFLKNSYQRPLFNYINFCKHLNFNEIERILLNIINAKFKISLIKNEIINIFINENTKFTHLYIPRQFNYQIHTIPGAKYCFSELEFVSCNSNINDNILDGLTEICKPIKELKLFIDRKNNNYGFVKLIKAIERLSNFHLLIKKHSINNYDESFLEIIKNSLIQHTETIQYFTTNTQPATKFLSTFVNLKQLELVLDRLIYLENLSLPFLQILKVTNVSIRSLTILIENTSGYLSVIKINCGDYSEINNKRIIQTIYQNCPKLNKLRLSIMNNNILELEQLLINCRYLSKLHIIDHFSGWGDFYWNNVFEILTKSSPINLFKFRFSKFSPPDIESLKLFFNNWKGRHPMILKSDWNFGWYNDDFIDLIENYKEGIVKEYIKKKKPYIH
ncbi:hypothetical protein C1645_513276 [Glomus cerebriforme]|uniref:F-box domain-containing protein n=1 Tax=Glomus cerebriforme TaxID=658196 RepID=A0A397S7A3_9GLOM|nr:hypothetical protein C1645_513276 [Glomus cerebriforme]